MKRSFPLAATSDGFYDDARAVAVGTLLAVFQAPVAVAFRAEGLCRSLRPGRHLVARGGRPLGIGGLPAGRSCFSSLIFCSLALPSSFYVRVVDPIHPGPAAWRSRRQNKSRYKKAPGPVTNLSCVFGPEARLSGQWRWVG